MSIGALHVKRGIGLVAVLCLLAGESPGKLSETEILHFRQHGFVVKRGVLQRDLVLRAREEAWQHLEAFRVPVFRHDARSWIGPLDLAFRKPENMDLVNKSKGVYKHLLHTGSNLRGWHAAKGTVFDPYVLKIRNVLEDDWAQMLQGDQDIHFMVQQLLGNVEFQPLEVRGIYVKLLNETDGIGPHIDEHPFDIGITGYLDDVIEGGGGFTVWPGSHKLASRRQVHLLMQLVSPLELTGRSGDIIIWHNRLLHMGGYNYKGNRPRWCFFCDFLRTAFDRKCWQERPARAMTLHASDSCNISLGEGI